MNPLLLALPVGAFLLWKHDRDRDAATAAAGPTTPSGVPLGMLPHVPLSPGAERYLPPLNLPEPIRNTYANAWASQNVAYVATAAAQLRKLGYVDLAVALENRAEKLSAARTPAAEPATGAACGACPGRVGWFMPKTVKRQMLLAKLKANPALVVALKRKIKRRRVIARMKRDPAFALKVTKLVKARRARKRLHPNLALHLARIKQRSPKRRLLAAKLATNPGLLRQLVAFKKQRALRLAPNLAQLANLRRVRRRPGIRSALFR